MTLSLPSELESRLRGEAGRRGLRVEDLATELIAEHLPPEPAPRSLQQLFAQWDAEDATSDPEEVARREREAKAFAEAINRNRVESEGPDARKPFS